MKKDMFATFVAIVGISMAGAAVSQNLVDPISDETDLAVYSSHLGRSVADTNYHADIIRHAVDRDPVLAATSSSYQNKYGLMSSQTRQLDYQNRRSGWRLVSGPAPARPAPAPAPAPAEKPDHSYHKSVEHPAASPGLSGHILGVRPVAEGLPHGSVEVVGEALARFRVTPGIRLFQAPSGKYFFIKDPTAPGSRGSLMVIDKAPAGTVLVDPASFGMTHVPEGFAVASGPDGGVYLVPASHSQ